MSPTNSHSRLLVVHARVVGLRHLPVSPRLSGRYVRFVQCDGVATRSLLRTAQESRGVAHKVTQVKAGATKIAQSTTAFAASNPSPARSHVAVRFRATPEGRRLLV